MKVVLIGASGATGSFVLQNLLNDERIKQVTILVRKKLNIPDDKLVQLIVNFDELDKYKNSFDADVAISCLGTTIKDAGSKENQFKVDFTYQFEFAKLALSKNISKFILLSSMNANKDSAFFYMKIKGKLEDAISNLPFKSVFILQPGSLIRPNSKRFGEKFSVKLLTFLNKLSLFKNYTPLHVSYVANAIVKLIFINSNGITVLNLKEIKKLI